MIGCVIDPYNRRLIWTIIRKLKGRGRCVLLTTHFLEEADVLSDRIAIMSRGQLQANGTPDFLKQQIGKNQHEEVKKREKWCLDFEYRLLLEKEDEQRCSRENVERFIKEYVQRIEVERETASELIYGIKRGQSREVEDLIEKLDQEKERIGIKSYGLSMTTIEDVFLR